MADSFSVDETNRLRISLGMKPLPVPGGAGPLFKEATGAATTAADDAGSTLESREAEGYENFRKLQETEEARRRRADKAAAVKKARDAAKRFSQLEGRGLGEGDGGDDGDDGLDARSWLIKQKKRQKEIEKARKAEEELAAAEAAAVAEYTARDLAGVKVAHELTSFDDGEDQVLTLKDTTIDQNEEEGDELENVDLREREKLNERLDLKKKRKVYNPNDVDETGEVKILAQYDEEIEGKKRNRFTLDGMGSTAETRAGAEGLAMKPKTVAISLDILNEEPKSDYLDAKEIKAKKPKKKKSKSTRVKDFDPDDIPFYVTQDPMTTIDNIMEVDGAAAPKKRTFQDMSFADDDDLQSSLAAQRREALKKRRKLRPEEIAEQLRQEASNGGDANADDTPSGGLVIDETSEFVANLQKPEGPQARKRSVSKQAEAMTAMDGSDDDGDVDMHQSYADVEDRLEREARVKMEGDDDKEDFTSHGLDEEATVAQGLGSTLKLLKDRGIIRSKDEDANAIFRQKQLFLAERQRHEAEAERRARSQRERDRNTGRLERMSAREKEDYARQQNAFRDQQDSRQLAEHFNRDYRPRVELKYVDDYGRSLNAKEAFKELSHQFHGKGSGKLKTEKKLKRIEDEKRTEARSALDGGQGAGMSGVTSQQHKKQRQAGVRLA